MMAPNTTLKLIADNYDASDRQIALVEAALAAGGEETNGNSSSS